MKKYPKVYTLGHRNVSNLIQPNGSEICIQEKIDGSNFSFQVDANNGLSCASHHRDLDGGADKMFLPAIATAKHLHDDGRLVVETRYCCEFLAKPKQNILAYSRVPNGHLALFEIGSCGGASYSPRLFSMPAISTGLEIAPTLWSGILYPDTVAGIVKELLETESFLGGCKVEGVVLKNYDVLDNYGNILIAKVVREEFKESRARPASNPSDKAPSEGFTAGLSLGGPARWHKAIQALRDGGLLVNGPEDIGPLMQHIGADAKAEAEGGGESESYCKEFQKGCTSGFPMWYKKLIANVEI
jgi:hypothetical protein